MQTAKELRSEATLAEVVNRIDHKKHLLFAVIIDISEPSKLKKGDNFVTKLRVIDPSFNNRA